MKIDKKKVSYVLGQSIGGDFRRKGFDIDVDVLVDSLKDAFTGKDSEMPPGEMQQVMMAFQQDLQEKQQAKMNEAGMKNVKAGEAFLAENCKKEGVNVTESGLQYRVIKEGTGKKPTLDDTVVTHYEGKTLDGSIFDSSYKREQPATFPIKSVIQGWQEAIPMMAEGSEWEIFVPASMAYGPQGSGSAIEPYATLIFKVELIKVQ